MYIEFTVDNLEQLEKVSPSKNFKTIHYVESSKGAWVKRLTFIRVQLAPLVPIKSRLWQLNLRSGLKGKRI